ncbi:hypothetical protein AWENTII_012437 [Aspergillus wentii]
MDAKALRDNDHNAGRRVRELYRYFRPEPSPFLPRDHNLASSSSSLEEGVPPTSFAGTPPVLDPPVPPSLATPNVLVSDGLTLGSPNATLNSFAQLAALRLNVQRVLISVSDRDSQFILAEATQSLNVNNHTEHANAGDGVWAGCSTIENTLSMCRETVALPPSARSSGDYRFLIVNDLSKNDRYKHLPIVQGDPHFRFYAGTPLTTETNINIGCFFVLDNRPRNGLTDQDKEMMGSLGMLIMDYFKVSRQASEGRRAARLSRGLSCFVEGSSSFVDSGHPSVYSASTSSPSLSTHLRPNLSIGSCNSGLDAPSRRSHSTDTRSFSSASEYKVDQQGISSGPETPLPDWWSGSRRKGLSLEETHGNSWAFRRAANLIRESLELGGDGGVVFLEAGNGPVSDVDSGSDCSADGGNPASVLAISTNDEPFAPGPGSRVLYPAVNLDRTFLRKLIRRYSKGKLWSFHRDGMLSSSEDERQPSRNRLPNNKPMEMPRGSKKRKDNENSMLNLYFPNASQVLFVPLWNPASSQWYAGCFCWNTIETHVFSPSVELSSLLGFGSSIMAECSRVESLISDRQKGDFIGSISHELRSPLHGILAAAEFLNGSDLNEFQTSLLETINACGRTLLDTMNQVLDFSKIVSLERTWRHFKRNKGSSMELKGMESVNSSHLDTFVATNLAILAEEVVEGVCLGHAYGQKATSMVDQPVLASRVHPDSHEETSPRPEVEVSMDIAQNDWVYETQPGALRRIIMNLFGNAMKYTEVGRVSVRLEVTESSEPRSRRYVPEELITLTVSDTGKGISEEFLRGRLYTPFAQEDTLAVGTGLGLSIVRSLVKALNGNINIHSRPGEGTIVKVSLPLMRPSKNEVTETSPPPLQLSSQTIERDNFSPTRLLRDSHSGKRAAILGIDPAKAANHHIWSNITRYLTEWYGLELVSWPSADHIDILLADEQVMAIESKKDQSLFTTTIPSLLILCNKSADYNTARSEWSPLASFIEIIRRPCGPHKLARSMRKCLDNNKVGTIQSNTIELPLRPGPGPLFVSSTVETRTSSSSSQHASDLVEDTTSELTPQSTVSSGDGLSTKSSGVTSDKAELIMSSPPPSLPQEIKPTLSQDRNARVLVVDDNSINLNLMLTFMKKRKLFALESAANGKLAVEAVEQMQQGYDIIFMDMSMPVMNGFEATRAIRALEKERDGCGPATIIALTGLSSPRDETDALASGVDLFLTKPVSFKEVSRLLDEWEGRA